MKTQYLVSFLLVLGASEVSAGAQEILIRTSDVRLTRPGDGATVVDVSLPAGLQAGSIAFATLEFYVSATATGGERPYGIRFSPVESLSESDFTTVEGNWPGDLAESGVSQRVVLDATSVVKRWVTAGGSVRGAWEVHGGEEAASITVQDDVLATGVLALLRVWTHPGS